MLFRKEPVSSLSITVPDPEARKILLLSKRIIINREILIIQDCDLPSYRKYFGPMNCYGRKSEHVANYLSRHLYTSVLKSRQNPVI